MYTRKAPSNAVSYRASLDSGGAIGARLSCSPAEPLIYFVGNSRSNSPVKELRSPVSRVPEEEEDGDEEEEAIQPLQPRVLRGYGTTHYLTATYTTLVLVTLVIIASYLCQRLASGSLAVPQDDCLNNNTTAGSSPLFLYPDAPLFSDLSFSSAKLIDLAWNVIVAQFGRLLHGLILYHLAAGALSGIMEYSSVPYSVPLNWLFSTVSLKSVWSSCRLLATTRSWHTVAVVAWLIYATLYTLGFATIWSAAASYMSPGTTLFHIPGQGYVSEKFSDGLNLCWQVKSTRFDGGSAADIILGPSAADVFLSFEDIGRGDVWASIFTPEPGSPIVKSDISEEFLNLFAYAKSKRTLQAFFVNNPTNTNASVRLSPEIPLTPMAIDFHKFDYLHTETGDLSNATAEYLYDTILGWQYFGVGQSSTGAGFANMYNATFILNESIALGDGVVPYNSSIWWNGTSIPLNAPFLEIGADCSWFNDSLGACLCLGDQPITADFRGAENISCAAQGSYVWGFSSIMTIVGLVLEIIWLVGCWAIWLYLRSTSTLVTANRACSGTVRAILDLGHAIRKELGDSTGSYLDWELREELAKRSPVGYGMETRRGVKHISLKPMSGNRYVSRHRLVVDRDTVYG